MPICSQRARAAGSFWGRLAFMGKSVLGRLIVDFRSSGTRLISPQIVDFFHYRERENERLLTPAERRGRGRKMGSQKHCEMNVESVQFSYAVVWSGVASNK